jgi:hypothetical protein
MASASSPKDDKFGGVSAKWTWIFGIATGASFILALVFFVATQGMTGRDTFAAGIGLIFGATLAAFVSTFVFHGENRTRRIAEEVALAAKKLDLLQALPTRSEEISALITRVAELDSQAATQDGEKNSKLEAARESAGSGYPAEAEREKGEANAALHRAVGLRASRSEAKAELDRVRALTDDEFLAEQRHLRGLA